LIQKIVILGIVAFAVIAVAMMPSPGDLIHPPSASQSTEASGQLSVQGGPASVAAIDPKRVYANITVVPENVVLTVNQTFKVEVWINNVTDMAGWQIGLLWNKEVIRCLHAQVITPPEWGGLGFDWFNKTAADVNLTAVYTAWLFGSGIENDYTGTTGQYFKAECWGPYGGGYNNTVNGTLCVLTLTFQALQPGSSFLDLTSTEIGDGTASPIGFYAYDGSVEVKAQ